ncbi:YlaI family protein [Fervidibacillus albus]|uniref:YlaI family protein n=1 Tax=Fervidibacillus albus TaxID=2980026 RepID=A0A9E8LXX8_9BACI|nr:YlaI family protein [Fervidibacillus albus]WAA11096.1 YlaI family protein [Fervidibacillus albus]
MKVQCVICDQIENIEDYSPLAKKLRNRPIHTYLCDECYERIKKRTEERLLTGKFQIFRSHERQDDW